MGKHREIIGEEADEIIAIALEGVGVETGARIRESMSAIFDAMDAEMRKLRELDALDDDDSQAVAGQTAAVVLTLIGMGYRLKRWDDESKLRLIQTFASALGIATAVGPPPLSAKPWQRAHGPRRPGRNWRRG